MPADSRTAQKLRLLESRPWVSIRHAGGLALNMIGAVTAQSKIGLMITDKAVRAPATTPAGERKTLLVARRDGRLGNQLFLFSHLITCALETGNRVVHPAFYKYAKHFEGTRSDPLCRFPVVRPGIALVLGPLLRVGAARKVFEHLSLDMAHRAPGLRHRLRRMKRTDENHQMDSAVFLQQTAGVRVVLLHEWTWRYTSCIAEHYDTIRAHFTPVEKHRLAIDKVVATARAGCDVLVGVHIRHGDFREWFDGQFFHPVERFVTVMKHVASLLTNRKVGFLVCSDETHDPAAFGQLDVHFGSGHLVEDLYSLARCDYLVGTHVSSFSAWASFFGQTPLWNLQGEDVPACLESFQAFPLTADP